MTHELSRRRTLLIFILCNVLALVACLPGAAIATRAATQAGSTAGATAVSGTETTTEGPVTDEVVFGPGPFNLPAPTFGLSALSSYKATLTLTFSGTEAGQPQQWSTTYSMLAAQDLSARELTIANTGDSPDPAQVYMAEVAGAAYERRGENACTATVVDPANSLAVRWEPAGLLTSVIGAEEAGSESVNGVAASHYTFDERALGQLGLEKSTGETWVASDGGYIVRYRVATKGNADYFGEGIEGTLTWDYELTDVNQAFTFELPDDCPAGMVDVPRLADAADVVNMPGVLIYTTATSMAEAAAFYQQELPALGWQPVGDPAIADTAAQQDFTQADQQLSVIITTGDGGTTVHIVAGSQP